MERTNKDYAIEFAEYLAKSAEYFMEQLNFRDSLQLKIEEGFEVPENDINNAQENVSEGFINVRDAVYEFRKRAERCK